MKNLPALREKPLAKSTERQLKGGDLEPSEVGDMLRKVAGECRKAQGAGDGTEFGDGWASACFVLATIFDEAARGADQIARPQ